jgi:hypothetical protein
MKINNWINILTAVVDKKDPLEIGQLTEAEDIKRFFGISVELVNYIKLRTEKFKKEISTKDDHYDTAI